MVLMKDNYLLTGATGLIGSALLRKLVADGNSVTCPIRNKEKAKGLFDEDTYNKVCWTEMPLETYLKDMEEHFDYIIHCASPTASKYFVSNPVETLSFNITTTTAIMEYAKKNSVKGVLFLSSLESYGTVTEGDRLIDEDYQGYVNPLEVRSSYNIAKRTCECLCHAYSQEYGVPVKVVRLTQIISSKVAQEDMRVYAQFARSAAREEDIILHTEGTSARQYLYIDDAVEALITVLLKGRSGEVYNVANEDTYISVREMAEFVQKNFNPEHKVVIQKRDDMGYAPVTKLRLCTQKLRDLGWSPKYGLYEMYYALINNLKTN